MTASKKADGGRPKVLIAEDDAFVVETMRTYLQEWYEVTIARSGEEAVDFCRRDAPAVVIMDLMMPGTRTYEGDEAIRRLIEDPKTAGIPIIIQTGFSGSRTLNLKALGPSVKDVLSKPIDLVELKKKIENAIGRKAGA